jgi:hypothetical protein
MEVKHMKMRWKGFLAISGIILVISLAWIGLIGAMGYFELDREEITRTFILKPGSNLTVENFDGKTEVDLWDGETVEVKFIKKTRYGSEELDRLEMEVKNDGNLSLRVDRDRFVDWVETDFEIRVPSFVNVTEVENEYGKIVIDGVSGNLTVRSESGEISIKNVRSIHKVTSSTGGIELKNCDYVRSVDTDHGGIHIKDCGHIKFVSVDNGGIMVEDTNIVEEASADNGGVSVDVMKVPEEGMLLSAENGGVHISIPDTLDANFDLRVENGEVTLDDFNVREYDIDSDSEKVGTVNGGGPLIKARAENGGIILQGV